MKIAFPVRRANVHATLPNINCALAPDHGVTGHSVEMAAQELYTVALFGTCGKLRRRNRKADWAAKG